MLRFFRKNKYVEEASQYAFDKEGQIPQHIAIIMDGNGRGHRIEDCRELLDIKKAWIRSKNNEAC